MSNLTLIAAILTLSGALLLFLSVLRTRHILGCISDPSLKTRWKVLLTLMLAFLFGALVAAYFIDIIVIDVVAISAGIVFFLGSLFILLVVNVSRKTIYTLYNTVGDLSTEMENRKKAELELFASREKLSRHNNALRQLALNLQITHTDVLTAFRQISETAAQALEVERVGIWLFDQSMESIRCVNLFQRHYDYHTGGQILLAKSYPVYFSTLLQERVISANDALTDPRTSEYADSYLLPNKITSMLDAPIRSGGKLIGIICHEHVGTPPREWTSAEQFFAGAIADMTALAILTDERVQNEKKVRESEQRFKKLAEAGFEGIAIHDEGTIVETNSALKKMFGFSDNGIKGLDLLKIAAPECENITGKVVYDGLTEPVEIIGLKKDKSRFPVEVQSAPIEYQGKQMKIIAVRDITRRKAAEEAMKLLLDELKATQKDLEHSLALIRASLESTADGILVADNEGTILAHNKRVAEMWKLPEAVLQMKKDEHILEFILNQVKSPEQYRAIIKEMKTDPEKDTFDTIELRDGRLFDRLSKPMIIGDKIIGRVISFREVTEMRTTQQKLKELNEQLEDRIQEQSAEMLDLYHNAPAGYHSLDKDGKIIRINDTELKWLGYSREEVIGKRISQFFDVNGKNFFAKNFPALQKNEGITEFEMRFIRKDGTFLDTLMSATVIRDEKGEFLKARSIVMDITEKKKLEIELKQTEENYRTMIETAGDVMYSTDAQGMFMFINYRCKSLTGYEPREIIGKSYLDLVAPEWRDRVRAFYNEQFSKKLTETIFSFEIVTKEGKRKWVEQTVIQVRNNSHISGHQCIVRDVTARVKAQEDLRMSEERYRSLAENAPVLIFRLNSDGIIEYINRPHSFTNKSMVGTSIYRLVENTHVDLFRQKMFQVFTDGITTEFEVKGLRHDMSTGWYSTMLAPVKKDDKVISAIAISLDITERKKAQDEVEKLNADLNKNVAELEAANKDLEAFTYSVSHDLRAPLRTINLFVSMIFEHYQQQLDEETKQHFNAIIGNITSMTQLIEDLLAFSKLGKKELTKTLVDTNVLVKEVVDEINPSGWNKNAEVIISDLPPVNGDRALLHQVFFNLINNALKFSKGREKPLVEVSAFKKENDIVYSVKDNGVGFDMQYYDKLFKVFQRLHSTEEFEGSGVGLAIVHRIVTKHGGNVWAEGRLNEGASFYFSLPAV